MKKLFTLVSLAVMLGFSVAASAQRDVKSIDFDWYFFKGDIKNGESQSVDFSSWRKVDIPHDFGIEGPYSESNPATTQQGYLPGGIGWYKKVLPWDAAWDGKSVFIEFDGIFMNSTVWVNGQKVGFRPNGYLTLRYDITSALKKGQDNVVTVKADNSLQPAARWYTGSGIYRPARIIASGDIRIPVSGLYVATDSVDGNKASVTANVEVLNPREFKAPVTVQYLVKDPQGKVCASTQAEFIANPGQNTFAREIDLSNVQLWSCETPNCYSFEATVCEKGKVMDNDATVFGVKTIAYNVEDGFLVNGKKTIFKGICMHQDECPAGSAVYPDMLRRRLNMLKEMGCNAIRTTHHPFSPEFYDLCDEMGFMVMDECFDGWFQWKGANKAEYDYGYYFLEWWECDIEDFIRRDRNHPCIMMYSLGNEVWKWENHQYLQYCINKKFHELAPGIPTTQAWALGEYIDIAGFNANGETVGDLEKFHEAQPLKVSVGTEHPHTRHTRGVYHSVGTYNAWDKLEDSKGRYPVDKYTEEEIFPEFGPYYASSYDNQTRMISIRESWKQILRNPYFVGDFRWTAFDYLGEDWGAKSRTNNYGVIDLACFPKDPYYLYQALWTDKPMVHLLPHWNWAGKEGVEIPVVAWTNCDEAELFLNGKSLGRKTMDPEELQFLWMVPYKAGTLKVIAYKDGAVAAQETIATASRPAAVKMTADRVSMDANRKDCVFLTVDIVDSKGRFVPTASNLVEYEVSGPYTLIGVENGDIFDWNPQQSLSSKAFMGKTLLVLKATDKAGVITVKAKSAGLKTATAKIVVK